MNMRLRRLLGMAFLAGAALVVWFGLLSSFPAPSRSFLPFRFDLMEHILAFCWLSLLGLLLWAPAWSVVAGLILSAGLLEIAQAAFPLHQPSIMDWGASSAGVAAGWALSVPVRRTLQKRSQARGVSGTGFCRSEDG